ncbi:hypothetical protein [Streptomyces sp. NBC_00829]|uniref:hypothetical protein n=1 Tax=Streptomyces sp. NBC_00829 TaxID=2903679 RepID=UPI0038635DBB|nr:hypothetical protein OG293_01925 [Streptomyces sp. NBC_00829]
MLKRRASRMVTVALASIALVFGGAGIASADDTYNYLSDIDGHSLGYMVHLDDDPDTFKICDTRVDAHGVTGRLYIDQGVWALMGTVTDGGDAGCGYMKREITHPWTYKMVICWNGPGNICHTTTFKE